MRCYCSKIVPRNGDDNNMDPIKKPLTEEEIQYLEELIPEFADVAFKSAYVGALAGGNEVVIAEKGYICQVFPSGDKKRLSKIGSERIDRRDK